MKMIEMGGLTKEEEGRREKKKKRKKKDFCQIWEGRTGLVRFQTSVQTCPVFPDQADNAGTTQA